MTPDILIRAMAADRSVRILAVSCENLVAEAREIHALSRTATAALGRQLMMTVMMAGELKHETDRVSTIIKGNGPGGSMVCTGKPDLTVKGTIAHPEVELPPTPEGKLDVSGLVGSQGRLTVVRDLSLKEPYVGSVALASGEIAEDFAGYYAISQQQPSIVYLGVRLEPSLGGVLSAGGLLVQPLPGCDEQTISALSLMSDEIAAFSRRLAQGESPEEILASVFSALGYEQMELGVPAYKCDCSRERIEEALLSVGRQELMDMIQVDHGANVQCHFCNRTYAFSQMALEELLERAGSNPS
jgi:molecular chaperone Hsp33